MTIGSSWDSMLQLRDEEIAPQEGAIIFTPSLVTYICHETEPKTVVRRVEVQIGSFHISARVESHVGLSLNQDRGRRTSGEPASARRLPPMVSPDSVVAFGTRSLEVLDMILGELVRLRDERLAFSTLSERAESPLTSATNVQEVTDYLLDPSGPPGRLAELRTFLFELFERQPSAAETRKPS